MSKSHSRDQVSLCSFTFSDGRRCRTPRAGHPQLCYFHAEREAKARAAERVGREVADAFSGEYVSACDLSVALARTIAATAQGHFGPKTASAIARLGQTLMRAIQHAEYEYAESRGPGEWRRAVRSSFAPPDATPPASAPPDSQPKPEPVAANRADENTGRSACATGTPPMQAPGVAHSGTDGTAPASTASARSAPPAAHSTPARPTQSQPLPADAAAYATQILSSLKH